MSSAHQEQEWKLKIATITQSVLELALIAVFIAGAQLQMPYGAGGFIFSILSLISTPTALKCLSEMHEAMES